MKRLIWIMLALFLPCAAIAQEAMYSISEVAAMTPEYYEGTCKLDGKRTIDFRAPVFVPDVEKMPVMRVRHQMLDQEEALQFEAIEKFENTTSFQKNLILSKCLFLSVKILPEQSQLIRYYLLRIIFGSLILPQPLKMGKVAIR